jgi:hypothetical protein
VAAVLVVVGIRGIPGRHPLVTIKRVERAGNGSADVSSPAATPGHQPILGDLGWRRRGNIHHLTTYLRGLLGTLK